MKILVALDCINNSHAGLEMLLSRRWAPDTVIRFVTAIDRFESISEFFVSDPSESWTAEQERIDQVRQYLASVVRGVSQRLSPSVGLEEHVLLGHVKEELLKFAEDWRPDLIVIGAQVKKTLALPFLGSVAQSVLQHSYCSVHIARSKGESSSSGQPLANILVAVDHSPHSNATVDWVLKQGWIRPVRIRLVTALPSVSEQISREKNADKSERMLAAQKEMRISVEERLQACVRGMEERLGAGVVDCASLEGTPTEVILQAAGQWPADLIVMGSHGKSGITRFLLGTVSQAVAIHAPCPVEVVKLNVQPPREKPHEQRERNQEQDQDRMPHVVI